MVREVVLNVVEELKKQLPSSQICQCLGVPQSTYYHWQKNEQREEMKRKNESNEKLVNSAATINFDMDIEKLQRYSIKPCISTIKPCSVLCRNTVGNAG